MKKILFVITFITTTLLSLHAQQTADLEKLVNQTRREAGMQHGVLAVTVYNVNTNKVIYSQNGDLSVTPASVAKLFTTGVATSTATECYTATYTSPEEATPC